MTEYGEPTRSEKHKGSQTASVKAGKGIGDDKEVAKENYTWKDAFGELIEKTKIKKEETEDKKITGKGVDNSKLIKVFPDEVKEDAKYGYDKDGKSLNPADQEEEERKDDELFGSPNKKKGKKAKKDYDGDGKLESPEAEYKGSKDKAIKKAISKEEVEKLEEKDSYKKVAAVIDYYRSKKGTDDATYDSMHGKKKEAKKERDYAAFERDKMKKDDPDWKHKKGSTSESVEAEKYIETIQQIKKAELQADIARWTPESEQNQKKVEEGKSVVKKEVEDLQTAAETGKGKYVAKADKVPQVGGTPASKQDEVEDPRSMKTKWDLVKNRLRAMGLKMSQELEGDTIEESEKVAAGAQKRAEQLGAKRRQASYKKYGSNVGSPGKNERAGYKLSQAARSSDSSLETQRTKKKRPAGDDTSQIGHYKKRDEKTSVGKRGGKLKTPKYKLSLSQRVDHHSNKALNRRDPKQNPKHTANESVQSALDALNTYDAKNAKLHGSVRNK